MIQQLSTTSQAHVDAPSERSNIRFRRSRLALRLFRFHPVWIWSVNLLAVAAVIVWLLLDPRFEASVEWWRFGDDGKVGSSSLRDMGDWRWLGFRNQIVVVTCSLAAMMNVLMLIGLAIGHSKSRSVRGWLIATSILALWLFVATGWQDITWLGKQHRLRVVLNEFEEAIEELKKNWPKRDDERPIIGPFMAYPIQDPSTLILLTLPKFETTNTSIAVIEGGNGIIRLELVGAEQGDWLEWHPPDSEPRSFASGLGEFYRIARYQQLGQNWYLVRYDADLSNASSWTFHSDLNGL